MGYDRPLPGSPESIASVLDLLALCFPGFRESEGIARGHGLRWEEISTPFVRLEEGVPVSHLGLLEMTLVVGGRERVVGGFHAVCTHPDHRRRGHFRSHMEEALAFCGGRYETLVLTAGVPALYEPFGFRHFAEHLFVGEWDGRGGRGGLRELDRGDREDLARLHRLLAEREPVSEVLGAVRERDVFLFATARTPLLRSDELDLVVAARRDGTTLRILDVVARRVPTLDRLLDLFEAPVERVEVCFAADRLGGDLTPTPHLLDGDDHLMVRGPFLPDATPAMLSPVSRC